MSRIPKVAAECNSKAAKNNDTAFTESAFTPKNTSDGGGDEQTQAEDKWILFNPELAELMGGMDGIICAVLAYGIYLWLKTPAKPFGYNPTIDGRKAAYRSTRELMGEYSIDGKPLWDAMTILGALKRMAKKKCGFILDTTREQLHFTMNEKMMKMHSSTKGFLGFKLSDAVKYGGALEGMLLANLDNQMKEFKEFVTDHEENKYGELSATKLTDKEHVDRDYRKGRILPVSKDAVDTALANLRNAHALIQHPVRKSFYRRNTKSEKMGKCGMNGSKHREAKISSGEAKISRGEAKISRGVVENVPKCPNNSTLQHFLKSLDSNTDSNVDRKCINSHPESSLRSDSPCDFEDSRPSPDGKKEMMHELIAHEQSTPLLNDASLHTPDIKGEASDVGCDLSAGGRFLLDTLKRTPLNPLYAFHPLAPNSPEAVYEVLDDDRMEFIGWETAYDFIPLDPNTGKQYSRAAEIGYSIKDLKTLLRLDGIRYTLAEIEQVRRLFITHPSLTLDHIRILLRWCEPRIEPFYIGDWSAPKKGHDKLYWARRTRSLKTFLRYLPDIIKEWYRNEIMEGLWGEYPRLQDEEGELVEVDYSSMPEPFLSIAFAADELLLNTYKRHHEHSMAWQVMEYLRDECAAL